PVRRGGPAPAGEPARSPGMLTRHYSPGTPLVCLEPSGATPELTEAERLVCFGGPPGGLPDAVTVALPGEPAAASAVLYDALHRLDRLGLGRIFVILPPESDEWMAVRDRLLRAAA